MLPTLQIPRSFSETAKAPLHTRGPPAGTAPRLATEADPTERLKPQSSGRPWGRAGEIASPPDLSRAPSRPKLKRAPSRLLPARTLAKDCAKAPAGLASTGTTMEESA